MGWMAPRVCDHEGYVRNLLATVQFTGSIIISHKFAQLIYEMQSNAISL